ncbi:MAG: pseudaminic acid synthase [Candidatus Omnitrophica bacterium]|nr:pseudaminic acid synthase [Candidatus Omnitrophota bacterium]
MKKQSVFIVAEISANHGQNFKRAVALIKKAKECGADAVKFQTYTPDTITIDVDNKYFSIQYPRLGKQSLYQLYSKAYTPWSWFKKLKKIADDMGIVFFSTAFDKTSVDFLEELQVPMHKIASFELVDLPLIEYAAQKKKPIIISTGMGTIKEIKEAVIVAQKAGNKNIVLLKCVSAYPAHPEEMNLKTIPDMKKMFNLPVGLSDHSLDAAVPVSAVSLGAVFIEKHFTLSRSIKTPDSFFSTEPSEFKEIVKNIRIVEKAIGKVHYGVTKEDFDNHVFRRSLFAVEPIKKGEIFSEINLRSIRPAYGLAPKYLKEILGKRSRLNIKKGTPLTWGMVDE